MTRTDVAVCGEVRSRPRGEDVAVRGEARTRPKDEAAAGTAARSARREDGVRPTARAAVAQPPRRAGRARREGDVPGGVCPQRLARRRSGLPGAPIPPRSEDGHPRTRPRPTDRLRAHHPPKEGRLHRLRNDRGSSILEFAGFLPILLLVGMAAIQLGLIGYGISQAGSAARAAARAESLQPGTGQAAGVAAASAWLNPNPAVAPGADTTTATVTVTVPSVVPLFDPVLVERSATMPNDTDD
ncbi:TadE family protein [Streptomyces europaeiscabiei]|uniref:TadE family protein n=1 Tax=Streptomyces europaeiscabiei TaxID=146819 RepID=UPI0029BF51AF|nr:TadE family protein [Streptomyces europaeiscabiei]MDX3619310.1 pilus assembly protein [Streptomyces europaeiscabiei]